MSVNGLGGGIDEESLLGHPVNQAAHVVAQIRALVALGENDDDLIERALPVAELEHLGGRRVEPHRPLGHEQHVLLADVVVAQARAGGQPGTGHASGVGEIEPWLSPRSMASSCAHSSSVLKRSAATAASCWARVVQRSTVR